MKSPIGSVFIKFNDNDNTSVLVRYRIAPEAKKITAIIFACVNINPKATANKRINLNP